MVNPPINYRKNQKPFTSKRKLKWHVEDQKPVKKEESQFPAVDIVSNP